MERFFNNDFAAIRNALQHNEGFCYQGNSPFSLAIGWNAAGKQYAVMEAALRELMSVFCQ